MATNESDHQFLADRAFLMVAHAVVIVPLSALYAQVVVNRARLKPEPPERSQAGPQLTEEEILPVSSQEGLIRMPENRSG